MATKKGIWISYDFGLKGDYTGLFTWLDNHQAVECGNGSAFISYDIGSLGISDDSEKLVETISSDIKEYVKLSKSDRLYIVWKDSNTDKIKGEFISGSRKQAPWEGYGKLKGVSQTDSAL